VPQRELACHPEGELAVAFGIAGAGGGYGEGSGAEDAGGGYRQEGRIDAAAERYDDRAEPGQAGVEPRRLVSQELTPRR
jgi:hypothetical protein